MRTWMRTVVMWTMLCGFAYAQSASTTPQQGGLGAARPAGFELPAWATSSRATVHFVYRFCPIEPPPQILLDAQEDHYKFFADVFQVQLPRQVYYLKYPDVETFQKAARGAGGFFSRADNCIHSLMWFQPHEAVHAYLPSRNPFLREGIAEAFGTTFYWGWGDIGEPPPLRQGALLQCFLREPDEEGRFLGCNFVRWVFCRFGAKKLVALVQKATDDREETRIAVREVFSKSLPDLALQWEREQDWLAHQKAPDGFFVRLPWKERPGSKPRLAKPVAQEPEVAKALAEQSKDERRVPAGWVRIINHETGLHLCAAERTADETDVVQVLGRRSKDGKRRTGVWQIEPSPRFKGYYKIRNEYSGLYLAIKNRSSERGAGAWQSPDGEHAGTLWKLEPLGDGFWTIASRHSGQLLEVPGDEDRSIARQFPRRDGAQSQEWRFESAEAL